MERSRRPGTLKGLAEGLTEQVRTLSDSVLLLSTFRVTLQFQLLGFASCDRRQLAARYCKTACLRNQCLVHRVCGCLENLALVEFNIEVRPGFFGPMHAPSTGLTLCSLHLILG